MGQQGIMGIEMTMENEGVKAMGAGPSHFCIKSCSVMHYIIHWLTISHVLMSTATSGFGLKGRSDFNE